MNPDYCDIDIIEFEKDLVADRSRKHFSVYEKDEDGYWPHLSFRVFGKYHLRMALSAIHSKQVILFHELASVCLQEMVGPSRTQVEKNASPSILRDSVMAHFHCLNLEDFQFYYVIMHGFDDPVDWSFCTFMPAIEEGFLASPYGMRVRFIDWLYAWLKYESPRAFFTSYYMAFIFKGTPGNAEGKTFLNPKPAKGSNDERLGKIYRELTEISRKIFDEYDALVVDIKK